MLTGIHFSQARLKVAEQVVMIFSSVGPLGINSREIVSSFGTNWPGNLAIRDWTKLGFRFWLHLFAVGFFRATIGYQCRFTHIILTKTNKIFINQSSVPNLLRRLKGVIIPGLKERTDKIYIRADFKTPFWSRKVFLCNILIHIFFCVTFWSIFISL